jgi:hypothetical protein
MPTIVPVGPVARNRIFAFMRASEPAALDDIDVFPPSEKLFSPVPRTSSDIESLKLIVMICGVGLLVSLLFAIHGVDLSPDLF